jgi:N-hydroxyarylamine O-acetyltransferase
MTQADLDLDAYLARIGYVGPKEASLQMLRDLHRLHAAAIAFENLSPLIGEPVSLALPDLEAKLVRGGRGGYCFEHNGLLRAALSALGFETTGLAARVRWGMPEDAPIRPRSHMVLLADLPEGQFVADVGFGGMTMSGPLALRTGEAQQTPHERFRLQAAPGGEYELQAETSADTWRTLYRFDLAPHLAQDYEPLNWFAATHPTSPFPNQLMAALVTPHRRLTLSNTRLTVRERGRASVERTLGSLDELAQVLSEDFGLTLPDGFECVGEKLGLA